MGTSKTGVLFAGICLSLAMVALGRAESATPDASTAPPVADQSSAAQSPDEVFRDRKLSRMGFWLILAEEKEIHDSVRGLRAAKAQIQTSTAVKRDSSYAIDQAHHSLDAMEAKYKTLNDQLTQVIEQGKSISKKNVDLYNSWVNTYNELLARHDSLGVDINTQIKALDDLQKRDTTSGDSRSRYINLAMDIGAKAEALAANYATLASDVGVSRAIAIVNQTTTPHIRLGPSGLFADDLSFIRQCVKGVSTGAVPVETHGGDPCVQAMLNGKVTETMVWDSGAALVTLSSATAASAGVNITSENKSVTLEVADGRKVTAKIATIDSIRLGAFTVAHVECAVLPPDYKGGGDLLGDTFQHHFVCRLDQNLGQLQLTPIDASVTTATGGAAPANLSVAAPVIAPAKSNDAIELLSTMLGDTSRRQAGVIVLEGSEQITTPAKYATPVRFVIVAQTNSTNLRLSYAADQITFNWESNQDQLRIDGGPADGRHADNAGQIPANQWVKIELTVLPNSMKISVDGEERYFTRANFSSVNQALTLSPAAGSVVKVKSVVATVPKMTESP